MTTWKKWGFLSVPYFLLVLSLEVLFRLGGFHPAESLNTSPVAYFSVADSVLGWRNRPNGHYRFQHIAGNPVNTTDALGYRNGIGWDIESQTPIVLFVGDSAVFCSEVNDDQTLTSEVAKLLSTLYDIRILNAGVRGYNTVQAVRQIKEAVTRFPEIAMVIYVSSPNDLVENMNGIASWPLKAPTLTWNAPESRVTAQDIDSLVIPHGQVFGSGTVSLLTRSTRWLREHSALIHHVALRIRLLLGRPSILRKQIHLDNGAVGPIDTGLPIWHEQWERAIDHGGMPALAQWLIQTQAWLHQKDIPFAVTAFTKGKVSDWYDTFQTLALQSDLVFLDIRPAFSKDAYHYAAKRKDGLYDSHYGPQGTETFARAILPAIRSELIHTLDRQRAE